MGKRLSSHSEMMALAFMVWLCSLSLIALFVLPFFGLQVAAAVAVAILLILLVICWAVCGRAL
jgi:uncharacterized membrane protein (DUF485 family)